MEPGILREASHSPFSQVPCDVPPPTSLHSLHEGPHLSGPLALLALLALRFSAWIPVPVFGQRLLRASFLQSSRLRPPSAPQLCPCGASPSRAPLEPRRRVLGRPPGPQPQCSPRLLSAPSSCTQTLWVACWGSALCPCLQAVHHSA